MMNILNLINEQGSTIKYQRIIFPDGQPHIKMDMNSIGGLDRGAPLRIICRLASANDLLLLLFVKNTLDYLEFVNVEVCVSYLLAARMDRVMLDGEPFSLKVVAAILNQGDFKKVKVFDPHSEVTNALFNRSYSITNHEFVKDALEHYYDFHPATQYCLVSPDAGALKKIHKLAVYLNASSIVECMKERDLKTGELTNFKTTADDLHNKTCFIIDDICDGGGTFAGTASLLKSKGAAKVILIVSHGIFSKGVTIENIDDIYTTNSYKEIAGVKCFPIEKYL
ncbi:ribose-phosphate pyrophosphokinase [Arachidicoccus ginsenosidivorans]|uniref:Ribose-phosphate pyrophosphokinase n=1 Tax=Arachidicoccus ginsenosidivorans TaxID=496057 RepID=A0A5B8VMU9_9BACT|nr:ribose-phosphate diphosphokinase [Arachidicoccus ginsenosidivorans]QEC72305.1 ribose-phosphate pyrophosphokinase [Arachidicoccus ginsenosidivorans]